MSQVTATTKEDLTGRDRMGWNVLTSWGGHLVFIVAGFIMPRMIDRHVGQVSLGIWDFCWSLVNYFNLAQIGVGSSVNRFVALYRSTHDIEGLRRAVTSVMCVQLAAAVLTIVLTVVASYALPYFFSQRLGGHVEYASSIVLLLGASLAVHMTFDAFRGVITGCHRWDIYNILNAGFYGAIVCGMIVALAFGGGLRSLAWVNLGGVVATEITRMIVAFRICPELRIRPEYAKWSQSHEMIVFGAKSVIEGLAQLLLVQANSILVATYLGPGALAVYSRPGALVRQSQTFINKFAFVLAPTAGSLQGSGRSDELRSLFIQASRYGVAMALPIVLYLSILGNQILRIWMGPRYENNIVLAILALGYFLPLSQRPSVTILVGMNLHGRVGLINIVLALCGIGIGTYLVGTLGWGLVGAALSIAIPLTLGNGVILSIYACRCLEIRFTEYIRQTYVGLIACSIPYALSLVAVRHFFGDRPLAALVLGIVMTIVVLGPFYWRFVVPEKKRERVKGYMLYKMGFCRVPAKDNRL